MEALWPELQEHISFLAAGATRVALSSHFASKKFEQFRAHWISIPPVLIRAWHILSPQRIFYVVDFDQK